MVWFLFYEKYTAFSYYIFSSFPSLYHCREFPVILRKNKACVPPFRTELAAGLQKKIRAFAA
jgi:hypothetical protein